MRVSESAGGGGRTHTLLRVLDFESSASANSATPAGKLEDVRSVRKRLQAPRRPEQLAQDHRRTDAVRRLEQCFHVHAFDVGQRRRRHGLEFSSCLVRVFHGGRLHRHGFGRGCDGRFDRLRRRKHFRNVSGLRRRAFWNIARFLRGGRDHFPWRCLRRGNAERFHGYGPPPLLFPPPRLGGGVGVGFFFCRRRGGFPNPPPRKTPPKREERGRQEGGFFFFLGVGDFLRLFARLVRARDG